MQTEYITGREYDGEQILLITIESEKQEDFAGYVELVITFIDNSRHIKGRVRLPMMNENYTCKLIGSDVLRLYDMGLYQSI